MNNKLVYIDNGDTKVLWGKVERIDESLIYFLTQDNRRFTINKKYLVSIREELEQDANKII